jgi:hypothetical protein
MMGTTWLIITLAVVAFLAYRAGRLWIDAGHRQLELPYRLGWALLGAAAPSRYWWGARIETLMSQKQADLLLRETETLKIVKTALLQLLLPPSPVAARDERLPSGEKQWLP